MAKDQFEQLAQDLIARAVKAGASAADVVVREGDEFTVTLRMRAIESLKEAASKALGLRIFRGTRSASSYSQDFSPDALERLVDRTVAMASATSADPAAGLPEAEHLGRHEGDLALFSPDVAHLSTDDRLSWARRAEEAALSADPRIKNSEGSTFEASTGSKVYANSQGFLGSYSSSYCALSVVPVAVDGGGAMQRDYWYTTARRPGRSKVLNLSGTKQRSAPYASWAPAKCIRAPCLWYLTQKPRARSWDTFLRPSGATQFIATLHSWPENWASL